MEADSRTSHAEWELGAEWKGRVAFGVQGGLDKDGLDVLPAWSARLLRAA